MDVGFIGLGKMGANMVRRLIKGGHSVYAFDRSSDVTQAIAKDGAQPVMSIAHLVQHLRAPRVLWMMIPAGAPVDEMIAEVGPLLQSGDILIDGGNSRFHDTVARHETLKTRGISYMDVGTSGGVWGLQNGYCMMIGGDRASFEHIEPLLMTLAPKDGYRWVGPSGAGHYAKMVHNGIEYGMMQAYAEGFDLMKHSAYDFNLAEVAHLWNQGSVVRSWLLELSAEALKDDPQLEKLRGYVEDSGEGRWTVQESIDRSVPTPVITASLQARFRSRRENTFSDRFLAALRNQFGGHAVKKS